MIYKFKENRVRRAYTGGAQIDKFVGKEHPENGNRPEEWLASTVEAFNPDYEPVLGEGLSVLDDGRFFKDVLSLNTEKILGKRLYNRHAGKASILVKLLHSAERLVIQCHPTVQFARERFGSDFGKAECWYFLDADEGASVYLGFKKGITREHWQKLFEKQDSVGMLECLHKFPVRAGDLWFVDGGIPHAIGEGCFMIELQEPSDLMVIPERKNVRGRPISDVKCHGGLGFEDMFDCFIYEGATEENTRARYYRRSLLSDNVLTPIVDSSLTDKFSMKALRVSERASISLGDTYAVCVVTDGECVLLCDGEEISLKKGQSFFVGADSETLTFEGRADIVFCIA